MKSIKNIYKKSAAVLLVAFVISSCTKTLDILPQDQIDSSQALTTSAGVKASMATVYSTLKGLSFYGQRFIALPEALADNGMATLKRGDYNNEYRNVSGAHFNQWAASYVALNRINIVLEALPNITDASADQKTAWEGELKFLRALFHFDLVRTYAYIPGAIVTTQNKGGIPLILKAITTAESALNTQTPRASLTEVYKAIYDDLDIAVAKAPVLTAAANSVAYGNKQAAQALYSRVALYNKDFAKVVSISSDLITARGTTLLTPANYVAGFSTKQNPESLFEIAFTIESEGLGVNSALQTLFTTLKTRIAAPKRDSTDVYATRTLTDTKIPKGEQAGWGDFVPTVDLLNALGITVTGNGSNQALITSRSADIRNALYEVGASSRGNPYVENTKFLGRNGFINIDNVPVFRIAEAYLNRAEAYAEAGTQHNDALALDDLNKIRTNRGLTSVSGLTGQALIDEILLQRRLEFAFEGHRFFDLKRRGQNLNKPVTGTTVLFDNFVILPAIPQGDVDASKGTIPQNFGY